MGIVALVTILTILNGRTDEIKVITRAPAKATHIAADRALHPAT